MTIQPHDSGQQPTTVVQLATPTATALSLAQWADEARAAHALAESLCKTPFAGQFKGDPISGAAAILKGSEIGLTPITALGSFDVIQGQVAPKALTLLALVQSHGHDLELVESTAEKAVARYRRAGRDEWQTCEFTLEHARGLQLLGKDNWKKQPQNMLVARVTSKAARLVAADVILGIGYSAEELQDQPDLAADPAPARVTVAEITGQPPKLTGNLRARMFALFGELGISERDQQLDRIADAIGRRPEHRVAITDDEARKVIASLEEKGTDA